MLIEFWQKNS